MWKLWKDVSVEGMTGKRVILLILLKTESTTQFWRAIDSFVAPKIELSIRLLNASSGQDATSVTANIERAEYVGVTDPFENASGNNNVLHLSNVKNETRNNLPDEVNELSVPGTRFDRQTHTHHRVRKRQQWLHPWGREWVTSYKNCFILYFYSDNLSQYKTYEFKHTLSLMLSNMFDYKIHSTGVKFIKLYI